MFIYSKGPWKAEFQENTPCRFDGADSDTAYFLTPVDGYQDTSEQKGNAALIRNAPEMYEFIQSVLREQLEFGAHGDAELISKAQLILNKIEGEK